MKNLSAFKTLLAKPGKIVIVTHFRPDADALGSSLGMALYLKKKQHTVQVVVPSSYPSFLSWMPESDEVLVISKGKEQEEAAKKLIDNAEFVFCLDFSNLDRVNILGNFIKTSPAKKILIDHHLEPEQFADFEHWDPHAASTAGLIFDLIDKMGEKSAIDPAIANCLYAGLMTDTGGFRHPNTTHTEFLIASELVDAGANPSYVSKMVYDSNTLSRIRFTGFVLHEKLNVLPEYNTVYMPISTDALKQFNAQNGDTEGLVNYGLSIAGIQLAVLLYEWKSEVKLSLRSLGKFPANEIAKKYFNGGGHRNAAGGVSKESLEETVKKLLSILPKYKTQLNQEI